MATIEVLREGADASFRVRWDLAPVVEAVDRLRSASNGGAIGLKVQGRRPAELLPSLKQALRKHRPLVISGLRDFQAFIGSNIRHIPDIDRKLSVLFSRLPDWSLGRMQVYARNGELWTFGPEELAKNVFGPDPTFFREASGIAELSSAVSEAFRDQTVIYAKSSVADTRYFNAMFPQVVRQAPNSAWIFLDAQNEFPEIALPAIDRDYIDEEEMIEALAKALNTTYASASAFTRKHRRAAHAYQYSGRRLTEYDFQKTVEHFIEIARRTGIEEIPEVPPPRAAPLQFVAGKDSLRLADTAATAPTPRDVLAAALSEIDDLIADVLDHHNLGNGAPVLESKLRRLGAKVELLRGDEITAPRVISFGMLVDTINESLAAEGRDLMPGAEGAVRGVVTQSQIFVNRFEERRAYLRDAFLADADVSQEDAEAAVEVIGAAVRTKGALAEASHAEVQSAIGEIKEGSLPAERKGILASVQNLVAVAAAFAKELIVHTGRFAAGAAGKAATAVAGGAIILLLLKSEPSLVALAQAHPGLFGWVVDFMNWLRSSVEVLRLRA